MLFQNRKVKSTSEINNPTLKIEIVLIIDKMILEHHIISIRFSKMSLFIGIPLLGVVVYCDRDISFLLLDTLKTPYKLKKMDNRIKAYLSGIDMFLFL